MAFLFLEKPVELDYNGQFNQWCSFELDIIDTKLFKLTIVISSKKKILTNMCTLSIVNMGMVDIFVSNVFK